MAAPKRFILRSSQYFLDGGTTTLIGADEDGRERSVTLVQSAFTSKTRTNFGILGRLHLDSKPVPVRSDMEAELLSALRDAEVRPTQRTADDDGEEIQVATNAVMMSEDIRQVLSRGPEENLRALRDEVVKRVESSDYVSFAAEVDSGNVKPRKHETPHNGPPCPKCGKPLRTPKSQQCFLCGAKWHGRAAPA